jgi:hypothetical protein
MTVRCALKVNSRSSTCRARIMASLDAPQSLSAAADTRQTSLFAMAPTRRPDFRTSNRLGSSLHRNPRCNPPAGYNFSVSPLDRSTTKFQIRHERVPDWEAHVSSGNISTHPPGTSEGSRAWFDLGQFRNSSVLYLMLNAPYLGAKGDEVASPTSVNRNVAIETARLGERCVCGIKSGHGLGVSAGFLRWQRGYRLFF